MVYFVRHISSKQYHNKLRGKGEWHEVLIYFAASPIDRFWRMLVLKIKKVLFNVTVGGFIMLHQPPLKVHPRATSKSC